MSYGYEISDSYRRAAGYVSDILKGAKPSDLPFYQRTALPLTLNAKAAQAIGVRIPPALLVRADEVIE